MQVEAHEFAPLRRNGGICSWLICSNLLIYRDQARLLAIWPAVLCPSSPARSRPLARLPQINVPMHGTGANSAEDVFLPMPARSLQTRIIALFLLLMVLVQVGGFVLINTVGMAAARKTAGDELVAGARVFDRLLEQDTQRLIQGARLLSADYAFREAIATGDADTVNSVLSNHGKRIEADLMMLVGVDKHIIADTIGAPTGDAFPFPKLLNEAEGSQQAAAMVSLRGRLYQLVIVPVLAPLPVAWVAVGFAVNDALAHELNRLTQLQVSFLTRDGVQSWRLQASTLSTESRAGLMRDFVADRFAGQDAHG